MFLKVLAISAVLAVVYAGGHTHIAHSIEIKHETPKKVDYHHQSDHKNNYESHGNGISSIDHYEEGRGLSSTSSHDNDNHAQGHGYSSQSISFHGGSQGYHKEGQSQANQVSSNLGTYHHDEQESNSGYESHGHAFLSQSLIKHETRHEHGKQESQFSGYNYEIPKQTLVSSYSQGSLGQQNSGNNDGHYVSSYHHGQDQSNLGHDSHGHAYSSQSIVQHKVEHDRHKDQSLSQSYSHNNGDYTSTYHHGSSSQLDQSGSSLGNAYSSQSINLHGEKNTHGYKPSHSLFTSGSNSGESNSDYSGYKSSYDNGFGLGHYASSQDDSSSTSEIGLSSGKQSLSNHSNGHSVSIHHENGEGDKYRYQEGSSLLSSLSSQGYGKSSENSNGNQGYYNNDDAFSKQSQSGKSHGHSISIHHETGHGHSNGGYESQSSSTGSSQINGGLKSQTSSSFNSFELGDSSSLHKNDGLDKYSQHKSQGHSVLIHHGTGYSQGGKQSESSEYSGSSSLGLSNINKGYEGHSYHDSSSSQLSGSSINLGQQIKSDKSHGHSISIHHDTGRNYGGYHNGLSSSSYKSGVLSTGNLQSSSENQGYEGYSHHGSLSNQNLKSHGHSVSIQHETGHGHDGYQIESSSKSINGHNGNSYQDLSSGQQSAKSHGHSISIHHESRHGNSYGGHQSTSSSDALSSQSLKHGHEGNHYEAPSNFGSSSGLGLVNELKNNDEYKYNDKKYYHKDSLLESGSSSSSDGYSTSSQSLGSNKHGYESSSQGSSDSLNGLSGYGEEHHYVEHHTLPKYEFHYSVKDQHTQHERRDGYAVKGEYSLRQPDGSQRVVEYQADEHNGFKAQVQHETHHHH